MTGTGTAAEWSSLSFPVHQDIPADVAALIGSAPWRDNAYVAFWDPAKSLFGVAHVSTSPHAQGRRARFSVIIAGRSIEVVEPLEPGTFASESIDFDIETSTVRVNSPGLSAELQLLPRFVSVDYSNTGLMPDLVADVSLHHFQSGATVRGTVTVAGVTTGVDGHGIRDRTWGPRDESTAWTEYVAIAGCLPEFNVSVMKFRGVDGSSATQGFLLGPERTAQILGVDINRTASGLIDGAKLMIDDGRVIDMRMRSARGGFWVPMGAGGPPPTMSAYDDAVDMWVDGDEQTAIGAGVTEQGVVRYT